MKSGTIAVLQGLGRFGIMCSDNVLDLLDVLTEKMIVLWWILEKIFK